MEKELKGIYHLIKIDSSTRLTKQMFVTLMNVKGYKFYYLITNRQAHHIVKDAYKELSNLTTKTYQINLHIQKYFCMPATKNDL